MHGGGEGREGSGSGGGGDTHTRYCACRPPRRGCLAPGTCAPPNSHHPPPLPTAHCPPPTWPHGCHGARALMPYHQGRCQQSELSAPATHPGLRSFLKTRRRHAALLPAALVPARAAAPAAAAAVAVAPLRRQWRRCCQLAVIMRCCAAVPLCRRPTDRQTDRTRNSRFPGSHPCHGQCGGSPGTTAEGATIEERGIGAGGQRRRCAHPLQVVDIRTADPQSLELYSHIARGDLL